MLSILIYYLTVNEKFIKLVDGYSQLHKETAYDACRIP